MLQRPMSLCEAIKEARKNNSAFRQRGWPEGIYAYHGMDNLVRFSDSDAELTFAVATLLADDWELYPAAPYHGKLASREDAPLKPLENVQTRRCVVENRNTKEISRAEWRGEYLHILDDKGRTDWVPFKNYRELTPAEAIERGINPEPWLSGGESERAICPDCKGSGKSGCIPLHAKTVDDKPLSPEEAAMLAEDISRCSFCEGKGHILPQQLAWRATGAAWLEARKAIGVGFREWAEKVGVLPSEYLDMENGWREPDPRFSPLEKVGERVRELEGKLNRLRDWQARVHKVASDMAGINQDTGHTIDRLLVIDANMRKQAARIAELESIIKQHDLCHDLHGKVGRDEFEEGCRRETVREFGSCGWADRIAELERERDLSNRKCHWCGDVHSGFYHVECALNMQQTNTEEIRRLYLQRGAKLTAQRERFAKLPGEITDKLYVPAAGGWQDGYNHGLRVAKLLVSRALRELDAPQQQSPAEVLEDAGKRQWDAITTSAGVPASVLQESPDPQPSAIIGHPDKPFHKPECQCAECLAWIEAQRRDAERGQG
jgi:hypothetical protein